MLSELDYEKLLKQEEEKRLERELTLTTPILNGPATLIHWTDSSACEVIGISASQKQVTIRKMKATLLNGVNSEEPDALKFSPGGFVGHTSGVQRYKLESDKDGALYKASRRVKKNGQVVWKLVGHGTYSPGGTVYFGVATQHYDFNF